MIYNIDNEKSNYTVDLLSIGMIHNFEAGIIDLITDEVLDVLLDDEHEIFRI